MSDEQKRQIKGTRRTKKASTTNCVSADTGDLVGECNVCCSKYTSVKRKQIKCLYCDYDVCNECLQQYLLSKADSHCMNCKKVWGKEFLKKHFSKAFVFDRLQEHYVDVLMQLETSLFPETMEYMQTRQAEERARQLEEIAAFIIEQSALIKQMINFYASDKHLSTSTNTFALMFRLQTLTHVYGIKPAPYSTNSLKDLTENSGLYMIFDTKDFSEDISTQDCYTFREQVYKFYYSSVIAKFLYRLTLEEILEVLNKVLRRLEAFINIVLSSTKAVDQAEKKKLTRCTTEKCSGYFTHDNHKHKNIGECKICRNISCVNCLVKLDDESKHSQHTCDPDLVSTVKLIKESTVPCPECKTNIFKIQGCDQMFCTSCNTAFDWKTGEKVTGRIHNPHYFQYLQQQNKNKANRAPQQPQEPNECDQGVLPDYLITKIYEWTNFAAHTYNKQKEDGIINTFWYIVVDFHRNQMDRSTQRNRNVVTRYRNSRVNYLSGMITKDQWRRKLKYDSQHDNWYQELFQLFEAVVLIAHNIYTNLADQIDEILTKMSVIQPNNEIRDCKIKGAIDNTVEAIFDLIKYYNEHRRIINVDYGTTSYDKIVKYNGGVHIKRTKIADDELDIDISSISFGDIDDSILTANELEVKKIYKKMQDAVREADTLIDAFSGKQLNWCQTTKRFTTNFLISEDVNTLKNILKVYKSACVDFEGNPDKMKTAFDAMILERTKKSNKERKDIYKKAKKEFDYVFESYINDIEALTYYGNLLYTVNNFILKDPKEVDKYYNYFIKKYHQIDKNRFNRLMNHYTGDKKFLSSAFVATEINVIGIPKEVVMKAYIFSFTCIKIQVQTDPSLNE
jgi:hypothetical protein